MTASVLSSSSALNQKPASIADQLARERLLGRGPSEASTLAHGQRLATGDVSRPIERKLASLVEERSPLAYRRRDTQVLVDSFRRSTESIRDVFEQAPQLPQESVVLLQESLADLNRMTESASQMAPAIRQLLEASSVVDHIVSQAVGALAALPRMLTLPPVPDLMGAELDPWQSNPRLNEAIQTVVEAMRRSQGREDISVEGIPANNVAAIQLLSQWLSAGSANDDEEWERLQTALDRDRLSGRKLFG